MDRLMLALSAVSGGLAVALGAFGAHALKARLDPAGQALWTTASHYHLMHATIAFGVATLGTRLSTASSLLFLLGQLAFCVSLYALALGAPRWLGAVTPVGGLLLIAGWLVAAYLGAVGRDF